jgi:PAS domain S-box-containing protein
MKASIKLRIDLSFLLLGSLFVINGVFTVITLYKNRELADHIRTVVDPSLKALDDFHDIVLQSKMYSTNWVFLRASQSDKDSLLKIHTIKYKQTKSELTALSQKWKNTVGRDSLRIVFTQFETILSIEKTIMNSLQKFEDYDDPVLKFEAEQTIEDEILPRTDTVNSLLYSVTVNERTARLTEEKKLEESFKQLWAMVLLIALSILIIGFILSRYLTAIIVKPVNRIRSIIDGLAKGITNRIEASYQQDEIGYMVHAVNNLSDKLKYTATFAQHIGERRFDVPFQPLSNEDTLGEALLTMRDNLKSVDESLNQAQHIARLGNWEWNSKTNQVFWSDAMYMIFGKDRASFTPDSDTVLECIHPADRENILKLVNQCLVDHKLYFCECRIINKHGDMRTISMQGNVAVDEDGEVDKMYGIVQDITERVQKEQEIREFNDRFQRLAKATNDAIWDWDLTTNQVWWSENYYRMFGYDPASGKPVLDKWTDKIHPDDRSKVFERLKLVGENHIDSWTDEFRYQLADGEYGTVLDRAYVLKDHTGKPIRVIGALQDITERKKAEQQIADSERRYRWIVETTQEGIWLIDENNYTVFVNRKMCEILGYTAEEMMGKQNYDFKDEVERKKAIEQTENRKKGIAETRETSYITKSGKRVWAHTSSNPIFDEDGTFRGSFAMVTDITQKKRQEELLKKSEVTLEMKNKELERQNRELEQFAYVASHDLQEPLRTTSSFVDLLQQQYKGRLDPLADKYLSYIVQASDRMKVLINDLLEYSRIGRKKELEKIDCNQVLNEVLTDLDVAIKEANATISVCSLPVINGYSTEIKQLFQNLIINAIKFRKKEVAPEIKVYAQKKDDYWEFCVVDNGIGIDPQHSERIFIIFQRLHTRSEYNGSGIGLSHCKKIVELHKGKIWVESEEGHGSAFHFTILENHN